MDKRSHIPRLMEVNDVALLLAATILIPLLVIIYIVLFFLMVVIPRMFPRHRYSADRED